MFKLKKNLQTNLSMQNFIKSEIIKNHPIKIRKILL